MSDDTKRPPDTPGRDDPSREGDMAPPPGSPPPPPGGVGGAGESGDSPPPPPPGGGAPGASAPPPGGGPSGSGLTPEARNWAMGCHLSALLGFFIPFANLIAPLVIWLVRREYDAFVDDQGKEAVNFQITSTIVVYGLSLLAAILITVCVGAFLIPVIFVYAFAVFVLIIVAAVKSQGGEAYRYPLTIRFIK